MGSASSQTSRHYVGPPEHYSWSLDTADVDGDGDVDVICGNNFFGQDNLYLNDGAGVLALAPGQLPVGGSDTLVIRFTDMDGDGDPDLLVGRGQYKFIPFCSNANPSPWYRATAASGAAHRYKCNTTCSASYTRRRRPRLANRMSSRSTPVSGRLTSSRSRFSACPRTALRLESPVRHPSDLTEILAATDTHHPARRRRFNLLGCLQHPRTDRCGALRAGVGCPLARRRAPDQRGGWRDPLGAA